MLNTSPPWDDGDGKVMLHVKFSIVSLKAPSFGEHGSQPATEVPSGRVPAYSTSGMASSGQVRLPQTPVSVAVPVKATVPPLFGRSELVLTWTFGAVGLAAAVDHRSWLEFVTDWLPDESVARQFSRTGWLSTR